MASFLKSSSWFGATAEKTEQKGESDLLRQESFSLFKVT